MEWQTRANFNDTWNVIIACKGVGNKANLNNDEYQNRLVQVRRLKEESRSPGAYLSAKNQRVLIKYDVIFAGGREWLVKPRAGVSPTQLLLYVTNDELFDVLHEAHLLTNHGTNEQMLKQIRARYCNVTRQAVETYLFVCPRCYNSMQEIFDESMMAPMSPSHQSYVYGQSVYFGFVDMRRWARDGYSYIMVHWDIGTRLVHIMPLQSTSYVHVAMSLLEIYASFGMPRFLDAPYDMPYIKSVVDYMNYVWRGGLSIKLRSKDDRNAIISGSDTVQRIMKPWLADKNFVRNWPSEVKYTQFLMNNMTYSDPDTSPITRKYFQSVGVVDHLM